MKTKRLIILGVLAVLFIAYIISIIPQFRHRSEWKKTVASLQSLPHERVEKAVEGFARDRKASGGPMPPAVPLRELVSGGYLRAEDIRDFEDRDVTVSLATDHTDPQAIWVRVRAEDGSDIVLTADGSIQTLSRP